MIPYILKKTLLHDKFQYYLENAQKTNQFTNYGWAAKELEIRARDMLKIDESKAVIACSSGTAALHAMLWGIQRQDGSLRIGTQDFTFASNSLGPAQGPIVADMRADFNIDLDDQYIDQANLVIAHVVAAILSLGYLIILISFLDNGNLAIFPMAMIFGQILTVPYIARRTYATFSSNFLDFEIKQGIPYLVLLTIINVFYLYL